MVKESETLFGHKPRVLVVDDNPGILDVMQAVLTAKGFEVDTAACGLTALKKLHKNHPDLMLIDNQMPVISGTELIRRVRDVDTKLSIILFSSEWPTFDRDILRFKVERIKAHLIDGFLNLPFLGDELVREIILALFHSAQSCHQCGKIYGFLGSKTGVGTTTLAVNVATALAQGPASGAKILLARSTSNGGLVTTLKIGLEGHQEAPRFLYRLRGAEGIIYDHAASADYVLLDLGVGLREATRWILPHCYRIIMTVEPQRKSLVLAKKLLHHMLYELNIFPHRICIVVMDMPPRTAVSPNWTLMDKDGTIPWPWTRADSKEWTPADLDDRGIFLDWNWMPEGWAYGGRVSPFVEILARGFWPYFRVLGVVSWTPELVWQSIEQGIPMVRIQPDGVIARQFRVLAEYLTRVEYR